MGESKAPKALHHRSIEHRTWLHEDGALEIEGRLIDTKAYDTRIGFGRELRAGEPVHDMTIRLLLGADHRIRELRVSMDSAPFEVCPEIIGKFESLRGESMGRGWNALLSERFARVGGCRHLIDLLRGMATVAFQSHSRGEWTQGGLDALTDSCHAFRQGGAVVVRIGEQIEQTSSSTNDKVK